MFYILDNSEVGEVFVFVKGMLIYIFGMLIVLTCKCSSFCVELQILFML